MEYDDQQQFAEGIIDATLDELRDQRDDAQELQLSGSIEVHQGKFQGISTVIEGPIFFETPFKSKPDMTFGQVAEIEQNTNMYSYVPFLVQPFVAKWNITNGLFDGFWLGLYAINSSTSIVKNIICWNAKGSGSSYKDEQSAEDSWASSYDYNESDFLEDSSALESDDIQDE